MLFTERIRRLRNTFSPNFVPRSWLPEESLTLHEHLQPLPYSLALDAFLGEVAADGRGRCDRRLEVSLRCRREADHRTELMLVRNNNVSGLALKVRHKEVIMEAPGGTAGVRGDVTEEWQDERYRRRHAGAESLKSKKVSEGVEVVYGTTQCTVESRVGLDERDRGERERMKWVMGDIRYRRFISGHEFVDGVPVRPSRTRHPGQSKELNEDGCGIVSDSVASYNDLRTSQ